MHAVWQALQPMHFDTSISLATVPVTGVRASGGCTVVADIRLMSSDCNAIKVLLAPSCCGFFHFDQEGLEFRCLRIPVPDARREGVDQIAFLRLSGKAPVQRQTDGMDRLAVDDQRLDALG